MSEMNWNEVQTAGNGEGTPYLKLVHGINRVRVVSNPYETKIHWEETNDGGKKKVICPEGNCPICKAGHVPQKRYQVLVLDRNDESKLKILEGGVSIFTQIKKFAADEDYGDPTKYDLKIEKSGQGRDTAYSVVAVPNKTELTDAEKAAINGAKSLAEINAPKSIDDILNMGLQILEDSASGFDSDWDADSSGSSVDIASDEDDWSNL